MELRLLSAAAGMPYQTDTLHCGRGRQVWHVVSSSSTSLDGILTSWALDCL